MSKSGRKGPSPAYSQPLAYPVLQGPQMAPMGAPPAYMPTPPPGHQTYPQWPYYAGGAVPQPQVCPQNQYGSVYSQQAYPRAPAMQGYGPSPGGQTIVRPRLFDAGAHFDGGAQAYIPPPPPRRSRYAAQIAAMQAHNMVGSRRQRSNFWTDGFGGGLSFW